MKRFGAWAAMALVALACKAGPSGTEAATAPADAQVVASDARPAGPAGKAVCEAPEYRFGSVNEGESVKHTFVIKNTGDGVLRILSARGG